MLRSMRKCVQCVATVCFWVLLLVDVNCLQFDQLVASSSRNVVEPHGEGHHGHHSAMLRLKSDTILAILVVILLLTVIFEYSHEFLLEKLEHQHQHLLIETVETLFRELMVLGFISLFLFTFTRIGATQVLNDRIFGENEVEKVAKKELAKEGEPQVLAPTVLFELFEDVHIFIFVVMGLFLLVVAFQIFMAMRQRAKWKYYESRGFRARQVDIEAKESKNEELEFWIFHSRFLHPSTPFPAVPADPASFPFHEYLSDKLGEYITEIVEIPFTTWVIIFLIALLVRPALDFPPLPFAAFTVFCSAGILIISITLFFLLKSIKRKLRPPLEEVRSYLLFLGGAEESAAPRNAPIENYDFVVPNNTLQKCIQGVEYINRQEALFCFGAKGPAYFLRLVQLSLFLNVVLCTVLIRMLFIPHWQHKLFGPFTYWIGIAPLVLSVGAFLIFWPAIIRDYTLCASLELFTDRDLVEKIDEKSRKRKLQRKAQILNYLRLALGYNKATRSEGDFNELKMMGRDRLAELSETVVNFYVSTFHAYAEADLTVGLNAVKRALRELKIGTQDADEMIENWYKRLLADATRPGLGEQDFMLLIGMLLHQEDVAHGAPSGGATDYDLFELTDVDGDGFITLDDFQEALAGLKPKADQAEIQQLLFDIAERSGRQVTREMFESWVAQINASTWKGHAFRKSASKASNMSTGHDIEPEL